MQVTERQLVTSVKASHSAAPVISHLHQAQTCFKVLKNFSRIHKLSTAHYTPQPLQTLFNIYKKQQNIWLQAPKTHCVTSHT